MRNKIRYALLWLCCCLCLGCKKFLDEKSDQHLVVPSSLPDLQMLLDNWYLLNQNDGYIAETGTDDYYLADDGWANLTEQQRNAYTWQRTNFMPLGNNNEWANGYACVYYANTVLDNIGTIDLSGADRAAVDLTTGHAHFVRGRTFLQLLYTFCVAYHPQSASLDMGIPLRLDTDHNKPSVRASLEASYQQVLSDLRLAAALLPVEALSPVRPSRPAAYGMLARTFLSMGNYDSALVYANRCLELKSDLMDFNVAGHGFDPDAAYPFGRFNPEVLYSAAMPYPTPLYFGNVDSVLYGAYSDDDLRKTIFFNGAMIGLYKGNYMGADNLFSGIATDEVWLMRAECLARAGEQEPALDALNMLLRHRWRDGTFVPLTAPDAAGALALVLLERRKELLFRGLRWMDIKRLNREGAGISMQRYIDGQYYTMPPNDPRWATPLPDDVIKVSGMPQNP